MTDWKELCRELVTAVESNCKEHIISHDLNCAYMKADAALAKPEPEGPTDEDLRQLRRENGWPLPELLIFSIARAVLARWGK